MEKNKETANELAELSKKMDVMIQHLSSINYLLLFGDKINKKSHYDELNLRLYNKSYQPEVLSDEELRKYARSIVFGDTQEVPHGNSGA